MIEFMKYCQIHKEQNRLCNHYKTSTAVKPYISHKTACFCLVSCSLTQKDFVHRTTGKDFRNSCFTSHRSSRFMACSAISHNLWKLHVPQLPITLVFRIFSSSFRGLIASKWKGVVCRPQKVISDWTNHPEQVLVNFQRFDFGTGFASLLFWFLCPFCPFFIGLKMQTTEGVGWIFWLECV